MPWLSIILALLTFFISKRNGASNTKALLTAGLTGAGSYYVTHETDWGKANLGALDGVPVGGTEPLKDANGNVIVSPTGAPVVGPAITPPTTTTPGGGVVPVQTGTGSGIVSTVGDVLKSWGGTGTAAVVGTTAVASSDSLKKYIPWIIGGGLALLFLRS